MTALVRMKTVFCYITESAISHWSLACGKNYRGILKIFRLSYKKLFTTEFTPAIFLPWILSEIYKTN